MAEIVEIEAMRHKGKGGFGITWSMTGLSKGAAQFRAVGMTAMRFPLTITEIEAVTARKDGSEIIVTTFIPTQGFFDAGLGNPVSWLEDQFDSDILGFLPSY